MGTRFPFTLAHGDVRAPPGNMCCTFAPQRHATKVLGTLLLVIGLVAALATIASRGLETDAPNDVVIGDQNQSSRQRATSLLLPMIAGLTIAAGGVLVGLGMGRFQNPTIVPGDSPDAERATTSRGHAGDN